MLKALRLRQAREKLFPKSARGAALANGWLEVTYRSHEKGLRDFGEADAKKYAKAFKVEWTWLMYGDGRAAKGGIDARLRILPPEIGDDLFDAFMRTINAVSAHRDFTEE